MISKTRPATFIANGRPTEAKLPSTIEEFLVAQGLLPRNVLVEHNGEAVAPLNHACVDLPACKP